MTTSRRNGWTLGIVSVALFMVVLDNLVVSVALPTIHRDLGASIQSLEWTVNAYVLSYAVLLLTGAALGDRFGRRRMFLIGMLVFTAASAAAALSPTTGLLVAARAIQGAGAALVTPLTLTLLSEAFPRSAAVSRSECGQGSAGPPWRSGRSVGGAVVQGISWHWIFWINVPIGIVLIPLAYSRLSESHGPMAASIWGPAARFHRRLRHRVRPGARPVARLGQQHGAGQPDRGREPARRVRRLGSGARPSRCCRCGSSQSAPSRSPTWCR